MLKKLKSDLRSRLLRLPSRTLVGSEFKALVFIFVLWWVSQSHSFLAIMVFFIVLRRFYFSSPANPVSRELLFSFLIISAAPFIISFYSRNLLYFFAAGILFFLILGIKDYLFRNLSSVYQILNNFLLFFAFIFFFFAGSARFFAVKFVGFFFIIFFLMREFLIWQFVPLRIRRNEKAKINLFTAVFSFLIVQFVWAILFLPIGFLNSAALALVIALMLKDLIAAYFNKIFSRRLIMKNITITAIFSLIIFMASRWQP